MKVTCISDLHGHYPKLEGGDLLIVAGDLTAKDTHSEYLYFLYWLLEQNYKHYIFIAGNHDNLIEKGEVPLKGLDKTTYLCDSETEFEGLKIWGSPWTKRFEGMNPNCRAFTVETEEELAIKFSLIPDDIDILITHTPPFGIGDKINERVNVGSQSLYGWLKYVERPLLHVFGHIHEGYGIYEVFSTKDSKMMKSINASHVNENYEPVNKPINVEL